MKLFGKEFKFNNKDVALIENIPTSLPANGGSANTANKLATGRTINGVLFDGSSNITITANPNTHTHTKAQITDFPTKLSQFTNDIGAGGGTTIITSATRPTGQELGRIWVQLI